MKSEENIDKIARDLLADSEVAPSAAVWDSIEGQLGSNSTKAGFLFLSRYGWIFLLLLLLGAGGIFYWNVSTLRSDLDKLDKKVAEVSSPKPEFGSDTLKEEKTQVMERAKESAKPVKDGNPIPEGAGEVSANEIDLPPSIANEPVQVPSGNRSPIKSEDEVANNMKPSGSAATLKSTAQRSETNSPAGRSVTNSIQAFHPSPQPQAVITPDAKADDPDRGFMIDQYPFRPLPLALREIENPMAPMVTGDLTATFDPDYYASHPRRNFYLGLAITANSSALKINEGTMGNAAITDSLSRNESASLGIGAKLSLGYGIASKIRISTGLEYAKWCRMKNAVIRFENPNAGQPSTSDPNLPIDLNGEILLPTGFVNTDLSVNRTEINSGLGYQEIESIVNEIEIEECFELISVPLQVAYVFRYRSLAFLPALGLNYDRVISKNTVVRSLSDGSTAYRTSTGDYEKDFLSYSAGFSLEYSITERWAVQLGANYKKWLTPIYEDETIRTYPYFISGSAGMLIRL